MMATLFLLVIMMLISIINGHLPLMKTSEQTLQHALFLSTSFQTEYQASSDGFSPDFYTFFEIAKDEMKMELQFMGRVSKTVARRIFWREISNGLQAILDTSDMIAAQSAPMMSGTRVSRTIYEIIEQLVKSLAFQYSEITMSYSHLYLGFLERMLHLGFTFDDIKLIEEYATSPNANKKLHLSSPVEYVENVMEKYPLTLDMIENIRQETQFHRQLADYMGEIDFKQPNTALKVAIRVYRLYYDELIAARKTYRGMEVVGEIVEDDFLKCIRLLSLLLRLVAHDSAFLAKLNRTMRRFETLRRQKKLNVKDCLYCRVYQAMADSMFKLDHFRAIKYLGSTKNFTSPRIKEELQDGYEIWIRNFGEWYKKKLNLWDRLSFSGLFHFDIIAPEQVPTQSADTETGTKLNDNQAELKNIVIDNANHFEISTESLNEETKSMILDLWMPEEFERHQNYIKWARTQKIKSNCNKNMPTKVHQEEQNTACSSNGKIRIPDYMEGETICDFIQSYPESTKFWYDDNRFFWDQTAPERYQSNAILSKTTILALCKIKGAIRGGWGISWKTFQYMIHDMNGSCISRRGSRRTFYVPNPQFAIKQVDESHGKLTGPKLYHLKEAFFDNFGIQMHKFFVY